MSVSEDIVKLIPGNPREEMLNLSKIHVENEIKEEVKINSLSYGERESSKSIYEKNDLYLGVYQQNYVNTDTEDSVINVEEEGVHSMNMTYKPPELVVKLTRLNIVGKNGKSMVCRFLEPSSQNVNCLAKTVKNMCLKEPISKPPELVVKLVRINIVERNGQFLMPSKSPFTCSNLEHNINNKTQLKQSNSENVTSPFESNDKTNCQNDEMDDECSIKQEEIHIKSEDGEDSSEMAHNHWTDYRNSGDEILELDLSTFKNRRTFRCDQGCFHIRRRSGKKNLKTLHKNIRDRKGSFQTACKQTLNCHGLPHKNRRKFTMFKCDQCSYQAVRKDHLKKHTTTHAALTIFKCHQCSYQTIRKFNLKKHVIIHQSAKEPPIFKCNQCSYKAIRKNSLRKHAMIHKSAEELPMFKCNQCSYQTIHKPNLRKHAVIHKSAEELSMFKCQQCPFQAKRKDNLRRHALRHKSAEELSMFKCDKCSYQTARRDNLRRHAIKQQCSYKDDSAITDAPHREAMTLL